MHERFFVLLPMMDLKPNLVDPRTGKAIHELLCDLEERAKHDELLKVFRLDLQPTKVFPVGVGHRLKMINTEKTNFVGILNLTPDSFSDGGCLLTEDGAVDLAKLLKRVTQLLQGGASIIDVGAESTRPGAEAVPADVQLQRALPALRIIREVYPEAIVSLDTRDAAVFEACAQEGLIDMVGERVMVYVTPSSSTM